MKNRYTFLLFILLSVLPSLVKSQPQFPEDGVVFDDSNVPRIDILINPDTLDWIYENVESYLEWHATFIFESDALIDTVENIGFRLRGNTSRYSAKKSFKVSFNTFEPGRKWYGLEKLNLNGEHNDPSIMRSKLSWDILRAMDVPAPRCNHVRVYINGNFYGVYVNVEHIDEEFVKSRFGNNDGNLYKCLYPADLAYKGSNPDVYKEYFGDRRAYDLKTNKGLDDYSDLAEFINVLNNSSNGNFFCGMESVFNIYDYLRAAAVDVFIANWDGYIYNKNNFYLYHNTDYGKFEYIPYDLDNTYGIDWFGKEWSTRDIYDWEQHGNEVRPLYTRIMENEILKDLYSYYMLYLVEEVTATDSLFERLDALRDMIAPFVAQDPYYPLDYGYDIDDFYNSFEEAIGAHVENGIKPYINQRRSSALAQLELNDTDPEIKYITGNYPLPGEHIRITAVIESQYPLQSTRVEYTVNGGNSQFAVMYDDGDHNDGEAGDGLFGALLPGIGMNNTLEWQIAAEDEFGNNTLLPCQPEVITFQPSEDPALFINEFMADNDSVIMDENGDYDDWVEIFNGGDEPVWMGDKYLTDDLENPDKWLFPDMTLLPGNFLLVWADEEQEQGSLHTNFKLDKEGEEIGLFDSEATAYFPLDSIIYSEQEMNTSFGRLLDGGLPWTTLNTPTPGETNETGGFEDQEQHLLKVFPNPVVNGWLFLEQETDATILNLQGQTVFEASRVDKINLDGLDKGLYLIRTGEGITTKIIIQ